MRWIEFHKLSPLEDAEGNQAAEELGLLAAGMLEEAEATKRDGALLALDQSRLTTGSRLTSLQSSYAIPEFTPP